MLKAKTISFHPQGAFPPAACPASPLNLNSKPVPPAALSTSPLPLPPRRPQETVLYALSSADARRVLERAGGTVLEGSLPDDEVLFKKWVTILQKSRYMRVFDQEGRKGHAKKHVITYQLKVPAANTLIRGLYDVYEGIIGCGVTAVVGHLAVRYEFPWMAPRVLPVPCSACSRRNTCFSRHPECGSFVAT